MTRYPHHDKGHVPINALSRIIRISQFHIVQYTHINNTMCTIRMYRSSQKTVYVILPQTHFASIWLALSWGICAAIGVRSRIHKNRAESVRFVYMDWFVKIGYQHQPYNNRCRLPWTHHTRLSPKNGHNNMYINPWGHTSLFMSGHTVQCIIPKTSEALVELVAYARKVWTITSKYVKLPSVC